MPPGDPYSRYNKKKKVSCHAFATRAELIAAVDKWMHFYNTQRRHSVIGMLSPIAYEQSLEAATQAA
jgi:transposase InsO family protein